MPRRRAHTLADPGLRLDVGAMEPRAGHAARGSRRRGSYDASAQAASPSRRKASISSMRALASR